MKIKFHAVHFHADEKLIEFIQKKMDKLEVFYNHIIDAEIFLRLNNEGADNKTIEAKINVPSSQLFAKEHAKTFEAATDTVTESLKLQLKKFKEKQKEGR